MRRVLFLLPVYNEASGLPSLLRRIRETCEGAGIPYRVLAVDDGSRDGSQDILREEAARMPLEILRHRFNRGLAETLRDGLEWVADRASDEDVLVTMDADDTHDPAYVPAMLERIEAGCDVVVASRFRPGAEVVGVPAHRELFSRGANALLRLFLRIPGVRDYACGYRAVRVEVLRRAVFRFENELLSLRGWGFICTAELLWKLHLVGARCCEIPFVLRYDWKAGTSKMRPVRTICGYGLLALRSLGGRAERRA
ncbi:MAG: dolichol-phosphate mannosyltransferase [Candidatus Binatia bacterium]|nr:MAG: dolichol-phosphate mannosyltransferase [Candidatus Binatia bacterium]